MTLFRSLILLCAFNFLVLPMCFADHASGGYFQYVPLGNNNYQVDFFFLRDCSGIDYAESINYSVKSECGNACLQVMATAIFMTVTDFGCGSNCDGWFGNTAKEGAPSFELVQYRAVVNLPNPCAKWTISVTIYMRNTTDFSGEGSYYNYCTINNSNDITASSATFGGLPFAIGCSGVGGITKFSTTPFAGTTLEFELVDPLGGTCQQGTTAVSHEGASSALQPIPSISNWNELPNGVFSFLPTMAGTGYFAVKITARNASNVIVSEQVIDGIAFSSTNCDAGSNLNFGAWSGSNSNVLSTSSVSQQICGTFIVQSTENNENVQNVTVQTPAFMTSQINYAGSIAVITVCTDIPDEYLCQEITFPITVSAISSDAGCTAIAASAGITGYYYLRKLPGPYCPKNLFFTNRNNTSATPMPLVARAEERIWIGDNMPLPYVPASDGLEGPVTISGNATYTAGIEVILPSCDSPNNDCVTIEGDITIVIDPLACSSLCPHNPVSLSVDEIFRCGHEQLSVVATGEAPLTYQLIFLGDTITQSFSTFYIHDQISQLNNGQVPYIIKVVDAVGEEGIFNGEILGTKRLYENIQNNTIYMDWPEESIYTDGYCYAANTVCRPIAPLYFWDDVNTTGPWYGATYMNLIIWDRWGHIAYQYDRNLQNGTDWSFDNYEIHWNGFYNNDPSELCAQAGDQILTYQLTAKNCYTIPHQEIDPILNVGCYEGNWSPTETKSTFGEDSDDGSWGNGAVPDGNRKGNGETSVSSPTEPGDSEEIICSPNPASTNVSIESSSSVMRSITIYDWNGKQVLVAFPDSKVQELIIVNLSIGVYSVVVKTDKGEKHIKLVKN